MQLFTTRGRGRTRSDILGVASIIIIAMSACSAPDLSGPKGIDPSQLAWRLALSAHAITMSTDTSHNGLYNTLQLTAVPRTASGASLSDAPPVTFSSSDSSVRVSPTGLVTARQSHSGVQIIATTVYQGIRISDTAMVNVTSLTNPPAFRQLELQVASTDSQKIAIPNTGIALYPARYPTRKTVQIGALDSSGAKIPNSLLALSVSDPLQGTIPPSSQFTTGSSVNVTIAGLSSRIGIPVILYASATVYGVTFQDSLSLLVTDQLWVQYEFRKLVSGGGSASPTVVVVPTEPQVIGVGGWIWWTNHVDSSDSVDVVFDDSNAASPDLVAIGMNSGGGNIPLYSGGDSTANIRLISRSRQFTRAGTFTWHSPSTGASGTIIVR